MSIITHAHQSLSNDVLDVEIAPTLGGAIINARYQGFPFLRPWNGESLVNKTASYPLVPFSNRISEGRFSFNGKRYQLAKNFGDHPHTIHGVGWQRAWQYEAISKTRARLSLSYSPKEEGDWPFAFEAVQEISLMDNRLRIEMHFTNHALENAPVGLGWHPYFSRGEQINLQAKVDKVWRYDERMVPTVLDDVPELWDFSTEKTVGYVGSDHCYTGFDGKALISWPKEGFQLQIEVSRNLSHLVFFTPAEPADFIAVEPVMNANDAINKTHPEAHGLSILAPNASTCAVLEFVVNKIK